VVTILLGVNQMLEAERLAAADVAEAKLEVSKESQFLAEIQSNESFSPAEEQTGQEDPEWPQVMGWQ
jgi:hypothetical protein